MRPPLHEIDTPAFVAWAAREPVESHIADARQVVELALFEIQRVEEAYALTPCNCGTSSCISCSQVGTYFLGIRQRLVAIAGILVDGTEAQVREESLRSMVAFWRRIAERNGKSANGTAGSSSLVSPDGATGPSSPDLDAATAVDSPGATHTSARAAVLPTLDELFDPYPSLARFELTGVGEWEVWCGRSEESSPAPLPEPTSSSGHQADADATDAPASE